MNATKNDRPGTRTPTGLLGRLGALGLLATLGAAAPLAHGQCDSISVYYEHEFSIGFNPPVTCLSSRSIAAVGYAGSMGTPNPKCGKLCQAPCLIGVDSVMADSGPQPAGDCTSSAFASLCNGSASASTTPSLLYGKVTGHSLIDQACQTLSITTFGIANPTMIVDPASLANTTCTFTITSDVPDELRPSIPGVALILDGEVYAVIHRPGGTVTTPAATHNPPDEWVFAIDCALLPGTLDPRMIAFDRDTFDLNGDSGFTQDDVDDLAALAAGTPPVTDELAAFDLNGNGTIDAGDVAILQALLDGGLGVCPGDVNGDGSVDLADQNLVLASFGQDVYTAPDLAAALAADLDNSGVVDLPDLNLVMANFGSTCP